MTVPIWLSLISAALAMPRPMAAVMMAGLVQKLSSPTSSVVCAEAGRQRDPPVVVVFTEPVLDGVHREVRHDAGQPLDEVVTGQQLTGHPVAAVRLAELRGGQVQGDRHAAGAGRVPGVADGLDQQPQHVFGVVDLGREPALIAQPDRQLPADQLAAQRGVDLRAGPDGLGHRRRPQRRDHELLEVQRVRRVRAAVEHVEIRHRHPRRHPRRVQPPPQRHPRRGGQRPRQRHRDTHGGVRAEPALVRRAVQIDDRLVGLGQRRPRTPAQQISDLGVHRADRAQHTLTLIPGLVPVPALDRLTRPGRGPGRHPGPGRRAVT